MFLPIHDRGSPLSVTIHRQPQKHNLPGLDEHMMMQSTIHHCAQTSLMDTRLSEYHDHGSTMCAPRQKQHGQFAHMFSRLTRPVVTANVKFLSRKIVALFIDSGCAGGFAQFANRTASLRTLLRLRRTQQ